MTDNMSVTVTPHIDFTYGNLHNNMIDKSAHHSQWRRLFSGLKAII